MALHHDGAEPRARRQHLGLRQRHQRCRQRTLDARQCVRLGLRPIELPEAERGKAGSDDHGEQRKAYQAHLY